MRWLEPCCGSGRFLRLLARRGARVVGVDLNPDMVAYTNARLENLNLHRRATAVRADIRSLDRLRIASRPIGRFDIAFIPHNSIRHLPTPADLTRHLTAVARILTPRGIYAVGVGLQHPGREITGEDIHRATRRGVKITSVCQYFDSPSLREGAGGWVRLRSGTIAPRNAPRHERILTHTTIKSKADSRTVESVYDLLCIDPEMWHRCIARAGLRELAIVDDERARELPKSRLDYAYRILAKSDGHG